MKEEILFSDRETFRSWLMDNNKRPDGVWITFGKNDKLKTIKPDEALEEALCFGWMEHGMLHKLLL